MSRFVRPETDTLKLANGDTLIVKKKLNRGERAEMFARMTAGDTATLAMTVAYLLDWNLQDENIPIREASADDRRTLLNSMDPLFFNEIGDAIYAHDQASIASSEAAKKARNGETPSSATSSLPAGSAGATSGSES